jgi:hypothetical protein
MNSPNIRLRVDHYMRTHEGGDEHVVVFVNGHALVERSFGVARSLAREWGLDTIEVTEYGGSAPKIRKMKV